MNSKNEVVIFIADQSADVAVVVCSICGTSEGKLSFPCPDCGVKYHSDCWSYNGGCAIYGCVDDVVHKSYEEDPYLGLAISNPIKRTRTSSATSNTANELVRSRTTGLQTEIDRKANSLVQQTSLFAIVMRILECIWWLGAFGLAGAVGIAVVIYVPWLLIFCWYGYLANDSV